MSDRSIRRHPTASLCDDGAAVVRLAAQSQSRHIFNGIVVEAEGQDAEAHIRGCNWDPFARLESSPAFFRTRISASAGAYTIVAELPSFILRYIQVQRTGRELAIVGKAMARRQWTDAKRERQTNVHEVWRVYWRRFRIPVQCDPRRIYALYGEQSMTVVVPRRAAWVYRLASRLEASLWRRRRRCFAARKSAMRVDGIW